jgi:hypothetical protein
MPTFQANVGDVLNVNGVLHIDTDVARILPRSESDITLLYNVGVGSGRQARLSLSVRPNPGTAHQVSFVLPQAAKVDLSVYDVQGRRVAQLARGEFPAGEQTRIWNGRTADGMRTPAGVYFYRLKVGKEVLTSRAVKLN